MSVKHTNNDIWGFQKAKAQHRKNKSIVFFFFDFLTTTCVHHGNQVHVKRLEIHFNTNYLVFYSCKQINWLSLF